MSTEQIIMEQSQEVAVLCQNHGIRISSGDALSTAREPEITVRQTKQSPGDKHRVVNFTSRILKPGLQVLRFQVRQLLEDFGPGQSSGKENEHIGNANAHAPDAGPTPGRPPHCSGFTAILVVRSGSSRNQNPTP